MKKLGTGLILTTLLLVACNQTPETKPLEQTASTTTEQTPPTEYTMEDVAKHNTKETCWSVIDGKIYDLTSWIGKHPGGAGNIMKICGADGTSSFSKQHKDGSKAAGKLDEFHKGMLIQ